MVKADESCVNCRTIRRRGSQTGEAPLNVIEDFVLFGRKEFIVGLMFFFLCIKIGFVQMYCPAV